MIETKVPLAGLKPGGEPISAAEISATITEHAKATGTRRDAIQTMVDRQELVPVAWPEDRVTLLYNSPNGL